MDKDIVFGIDDDELPIASTPELQAQGQKADDPHHGDVPSSAA